MLKNKSPYKLEFGTVFIADHYILAVMNEGVTILPEHNQNLVDAAERFFKDRPFGYITHRIHSYSVDPKVYLETSKISNLVAFAVVSGDQISLNNTKVEQLFLDKPVQLFDELEAAQAWIQDIVAQHR